MQITLQAKLTQRRNWVPRLERASIRMEPTLRCNNLR